MYVDLEFKIGRTNVDRYRGIGLDLVSDRTDVVWVSYGSTNSLPTSKLRRNPLVVLNSTVTKQVGVDLPITGKNEGSKSSKF